MPDPVLVKNPDQERLFADPAVKERLSTLVADAKQYFYQISTLTASPPMLESNYRQMMSGLSSIGLSVYNKQPI
jgi:hypothetical protein